MKRNHSENKFSNSEIPQKKRGIVKISNKEEVIDPTYMFKNDPNIFNRKKSTENPDSSLLNLKKQLIKDLMPPTLISKSYHQDVGGEISDLLRNQNVLITRLMGHTKKKKNPFKGASEKYEDRIKLLENNNFANQEVIDLQKQLLELQMNRKRKEEEAQNMKVQMEPNVNIYEDFVYKSNYFSY